MLPASPLSARLTGLGLTLLALAVASALLLAPINPNATPLPISDKVVHAVLFLCLSVPPLLWRLAPDWLVAVGMSAYGLAIEVIQPSFGRAFEWRDLLADMAGIALALVLVAGLRRQVRRRALTKNL